MDSNHDKVIQIVLFGYGNGPHIRCAWKGSDTSNISHCRSIPSCRAGQNGRISQCSKTSDTIDRKLRRNSLGLTLWKELPQFLERSAIVGDLIIGESNNVTRRGSTWRVRHGTPVILSGGSFAQETRYERLRWREKVLSPKAVCRYSKTNC